MGGKALRTEHVGGKDGGGFWGTREEAKSLSKVERRKVGKEIIAQGVEEVAHEADHCFWCGAPLKDGDRAATCAKCEARA